MIILSSRSPKNRRIINLFSYLPDFFFIFRDIPEDVLNTYCWIHSTYTVVDAFMKKQGQEVPFPGVDNSLSRGQLTIKHTKYYQWVAFTLFFQVSELLPFLSFCFNIHNVCVSETSKCDNFSTYCEMLALYRT